MVIGVLFILAFSAWVIPKIIFRIYASVNPVRVKAVDRFSEGGVQTVVYMPDAVTRKVIKSYRVISDGKGLYFRGEWEKNSAFVEYEVTAYGANNSVIEVLHVKDKFDNGKFTKDIPLPAKTDYVTLRIVCVDDTPVPMRRRAFNLKYVLWVCALCACLAVLCDLLIWLCLTFTLRCLDGFSMTYGVSVGGWATVLGFGALIIILITATIFIGGFFLLQRGASEEERGTV